MDLIWALFAVVTYYQLHALRHMPSMEWVLTKLGQEPPNKEPWDIMSDDWIKKMRLSDEMLYINATNLTIQPIASSYTIKSTRNRRRRRLLQEEDETLYTNMDVHGEIKYYEPGVDTPVKVEIAPESLKLLIDIILGEGLDWRDEELFARRRLLKDEIISVTRKFYIPELRANDLNVDGICRVEGQLDTVGQTNSYGNVDFFPGDMFSVEDSMFSFSKGLQKKKHHRHHLSVHEGELEMDGRACGCSLR